MAADADTDYWVSRWDSMQEAYNPDRRQRLQTLVEVVRATHAAPDLVLDVGCGTGSVMAEVLDAFPTARAMGIDFDFTLLDIARRRLRRFGDRAELIEADLRGEGWPSQCPANLDAVLSATALHWFTSRQLQGLYGHFQQLLKTGGVFLNADHVGCADPQIQEAWNRKGRRAEEPSPEETTPWRSFWDEFLAHQSQEVREKRATVQGPWEGVEEGLPLEWHFLQLRKAGFSVVDCFYRLGGDAVYGAVK